MKTSDGGGAREGGGASSSRRGSAGGGGDLERRSSGSGSVGCGGARGDSPVGGNLRDGSLVVGGSRASPARVVEPTTSGGSVVQAIRVSSAAAGDASRQASDGAQAVAGGSGSTTGSGEAWTVPGSDA